MTRKIETDGPRKADAKNRTARRAWPLDVRLAVARGVVEEGLSASQVAAKLGVSYTTALSWVERYRARGAVVLEDSKRAAPSKSDGSREGQRAAIVAMKAADPQAGSRRIRDVMRRFLGIGTPETRAKGFARGGNGRRAGPDTRQTATARAALRAGASTLTFNAVASSMGNPSASRCTTRTDSW